MGGGREENKVEQEERQAANQDKTVLCACAFG
jgi:hypothetical protein